MSARFLTAGTLFVAGWLAGCSSLTAVTDLDEQRFTAEERPVAHLSARVGGVYLFYYLPIVTGDTRKSNGFRLFHDETDVARVVRMVTRAGRERGGTRLTDLYSWSDSVWIPPLLIFWYRWTSVSANVSSGSGAVQGDAAPGGP